MINVVKKMLTLAVLAGCLAGCASDPTHYFTLNHMGPKSCARGRHHLDIGIGPIKLPKYLNTPQIVTRELPHKLHLDDHNRWAEALDDNVTRVLGDNLAGLLPACRIFNHPWERKSPIDLQVSVDFRQFEFVAPECAVVLRANYTLHRTSDHKTLTSCCKNYRLRLRGESRYHKIAGLMSQALYMLSTDIARDLRTRAR